MAKPLQDIVLSTTYITDNVEIDIQDQVQKLGGKFRKAVDASLNFLIVGERFTEKYNFAVAHGATLISADTFFDVYLEWKVGNEIDFIAELRARALKPMEGLIISTTNLSTEQKDGFRELIEAGGGVYSKDLIKKCRVLVSPVLKGKKAMVAPSWHIPVVHPKWVSESLRVKAALDPECFDLKIPEDEMGIKVSAPTLPPASTLAEDRPAPIPKRRKSDLLFGVARRSSSPGVTGAGAADPITTAVAPTPVSIPPQPSLMPPSMSSPSLLPQNGARLALFKGLVFSLHGFDTRQTRILRRTIESHMGKIGSSDPNYIIVNSMAPETPVVRSPNTHVITEWAIERSLDHKLSTLDDEWGKPVYKRPTVGFTGLAVCVTGFTGIEQRHVAELIKLMGATFAETLTKSRDLLIARSQSARKVSYAAQWDVPVASTEWLWQSALAGHALAFNAEHALDGKGPRPPPQPRAHEATARASTSMPSFRNRSLGDADNGTNENEDDTRPANEDNVGYIDEDAEARARLLIALGEKPATPPPAEPTTLPAMTHKMPRRASRR